MTTVGRLARWRGVVGLALRRTWIRATQGAPRQVGFTVTGIALPVALLVVVSSVSLGLAAGGTVQSPDVDYWVVPESGASSPVVSVGGPRLGEVHPTSASLDARADVEYATPVLLELVRVRAGGSSGDGDRGTTDGDEYVLAVGVVPGESPVEVAGASTAGLTPGDPHYADGAYDGPQTGEVVLSAGAATLLGVERGGSVSVAVGGSSQEFDVVNVSAAGSAATDLPVAVVHLAELQSLTGAARGDQADQLLVRTTDPGVRPVLESAYPRTVVVERGGIGAGRVVDSTLSLAVALAALAVALIVGVLFAATTLGLAVAASARERAVLAALGFSGRSRSAVVAVEALVVAVAGGLLGVALGFAGVPLSNRLAARLVAETTVARWDPLLVPYGLGVAVLIGLVVLPYLLVVSRRTTTMEALVE